MNLTTSDGLISGIPSIFSVPITYTIRANNGGVIYDTSVTISVQTIPTIAYPQSIYILTQGIPVNIMPIGSINNTNVTYSINSCPLPNGLTFNTSNGSISGTPLLTNTYRQYIIKVTNVIGSSQVTLVLNIIKVILAPPVLADDINSGACLTNPDAAMRRKAEILKYKQNNSNISKSQYFSLLAKGNGPYAKRAWGNQGDRNTNPNISGLPQDGNTILCNSSSNIICNPTSSSDVPGPVMNLCYNPATPLVGYMQPNRKKTNIGFKWPQRGWNIGDMGFPRGKAGSILN
jgi:hypothetical protein